MKSHPSPPATTSPWVTLVLVLAAVAAIWSLFHQVNRKRESKAAAQAAERGATSAAASTSEAGTSLPPEASPSAAASSASLPPYFSAAMDTLRALLGGPTSVPNEAVLRFPDAGSLRAFVNAAPSLGLEVLSQLPALNSARVGFDDLASLQRYLDGARSSPNRPEVEPHIWLSTPQIQPSTAPNNEGGAVALGESFLQAVNAVGDRSGWGQGITVAVLDTGLQSHPTFGERQITRVDLVQDGKSPHGHGTSVASLIAGQDERVPGIAPGVTLLDVRVANEKGISVSTVLAQGIITATDRGAHVINISLGGYDDSTLLRRAVDYAVGKGAIVVAAAGNENYDQLAFPAGFDKVISVGSVDRNQKQAWFSNSGKNLDFTAPGVGLPVAWDLDKMANASGTSQSAAIVSGVIATYLGRGVKSGDILRVLKATARPTGASPEKVGHGVVWLK